MHIPDAAISPATSLTAGAVMMPVWYAASNKLKTTLSTRQVPLLAVGAAFCFTIMMFNIPVPGGTTVHPVGAVLMAVLLGPSAAVLGVTVALAIQALFFADGGVLALGINSFTMAFTMPFCGYLVYRAIAGKSLEKSPRRAMAAGLGAYVGLNMAALVAAIVLGIQPALYHEANGHALYFLYPMRVTIPAMLIPHLIVAGVAEAVVTTFAVRYLQLNGFSLYNCSLQESAGKNRREMAWIGLAVLAALSPLGMLAKGEAWGEWSADDIARTAGYVPKKLGEVDARGWKGFNLLPDYLSDRGPIFYVVAAVLGIAAISTLLFIAGKLLARKEDNHKQDDDKPSPHGGSRPGPGEIPDWMRQSESDQGTSSKSNGRTSRQDYVGKTISSMAETTRETVFGERWARRSGLLQSLDARIKILFTLGFVVLAIMLRHWSSLLMLYGVSLMLTVLSRIPLGVAFRRVWLTVPLFMTAIALPAVLNIVTPGHVLFVLLRAPFIAITTPGLQLASLLVIRTGVAVSFVILLSLATRWNDLLEGMRVLFVPKMFLVVTAMTYRYLAVLTQSASEMFTARRSRTVGKTTRDQDRRFLGGAMGALFGKTVALTGEVHSAMVSRGWTGDTKSLERPRISILDIGWSAAMVAVVLIIVIVERMV